MLCCVIWMCIFLSFASFIFISKIYIKMSWSREQVMLLIDEYKKYPCLYAVRSKTYTNKHARQSALEKIATSLKLVKPNITINDIKNKFAGLKATFLTEYKKYVESFKSGAGEDEVYCPSLWYYEVMQFILDHIETRDSMDSISFESHDTNSLEHDKNVDGTEINLQELEENSQIYIVNDSGVVEEFIESVPKSKNQNEIFSGSRPSSSLESESRPSSSHGYHSDNQHLSDKNSVSSLQTVYKNASNAPKRRKFSEKYNEVGTEIVLQEASNTLKKLSTTIDSASLNTRNVIDDPDVALANFIVSKLKQIQCRNIKLEVEERIAMQLSEGIKQSRNLET